MGDVYITGVAMTRFGKYPEKSVKVLTKEVVDPVLNHSEIRREDLDAVMFANSTWGAHHGQTSVRGQVALLPLRIHSLPIINVENACAGGATALHNAYMAVKSEVYEVVLVLGVEKSYTSDRVRAVMQFLGGMDVDGLSEHFRYLENINNTLSIKMDRQAYESNAPDKPVDQWIEKSKSLFRQAAALPSTIKNAIVLEDLLGEQFYSVLRTFGGNPEYSPFIDFFSTEARYHMEEYGTTVEQIAAVAAKNHYHGSLNPYSQYPRQMNIHDILSDKLISYPLTRSMCAPIGDGAAAAIVCSESFMKKKKLTEKGVKIRASILQSASTKAFWDRYDIVKRVADNLYEKAGVGPEDIHVAELHDATAFSELSQCENLGFCKEGEGGAFAESHATRLGGKIPINTSGGLVSRGHPVAATGLAQIFELYYQLNMRADKRQVQGAKIALALNGGGILGSEEASMGAHILEKP